jgi:hypothetical protein
VDVVAHPPADPQAAEPVQVGERASHDPALGAESGAVLGAPAGDDRLHAEIPDQAAVLVVVVAAVAQHQVRVAPGPVRASPLAQVDQRIGGVLDAEPLGQGGRQQARVGDGVGVSKQVSSWSRVWEDPIEKNALLMG